MLEVRSVSMFVVTMMISAVSINWDFRPAQPRLLQLVVVSMSGLVLLTLLQVLTITWSACPFQNPFSFLDLPAVTTVVDKAGKVAPDRVRVTWGKVDNFKCVDFFQIEYYEQHDPSGTVKMSGKINKNRKSIDLEIFPCSDYRFKVCTCTLRFLFQKF